jgi:hypothetical protein
LKGHHTVLSKKPKKHVSGHGEQNFTQVASVAGADANHQRIPIQKKMSSDFGVKKKDCDSVTKTTRKGNSIEEDERMST